MKYACPVYANGFDGDRNDAPACLLKAGGHLIADASTCRGDISLCEYRSDPKVREISEEIFAKLAKDKVEIDNDIGAMMKSFG